MIKHAMASTFVLHKHVSGWQLGLILHPRLRKLTVMGGHIEDSETAAEAAVREVREESGLRVRLVPRPMVPLPLGFPHARVPEPWWIIEGAADPDGHLGEPHVHIDHQYVAVADSPEPDSVPEHPFAWYSLTALDRATVMADTLMVARMLLSDTETWLLRSQ